MAGIVPALVTDHDVEAFREQIDDLTFAFIAPLGADYYNGFGHGLSRSLVSGILKSKERRAGTGRRGSEIQGQRSRHRLETDQAVAAPLMCLSINLEIASFEVAPTTRSSSF